MVPRLLNAGFRIGSRAVSAVPVIGSLLLVLAAASAGIRAAETAQDAEHAAVQPGMAGFKSRVQPFLQRYCIDCHGELIQNGKINLEQFTDEASVTKGRKTWDKVYGKLEVGAMPPADHELRPTRDEVKPVLNWIDATFYHVDCNLDRDPGRVTIRRLNRVEYNNTIRDLIGVDLKPAENFPSDDVGYGFDNIGDVLSLPPLLLEKYMTAAEEIAAAAIVTGDPSARSTQKLAANELKRTDGGRAGRRGFHTLSSTGAVYGEFDLTEPGEYILRAEAGADQAGPEPAKMEFRVGGSKLAVHEIRGSREPGVYETRFKVGRGENIPPGKHRVEAAFINDYYNPDAENPRDRDRNLHVGSLELQGPLGKGEYPEAHRRIIFVTPGPNRSAEECARQIIERFATRAFRRPATDEQVETFLDLFELATAHGESFERGIQVAVQGILVSPYFLFRIEQEPKPNDDQPAYVLDDYDLASRLSYFLWSSMPDEKLFQLAQRGELHKPEVLKQQALRMLDDPKAEALVNNFARQWLNLGLLDESQPNQRLFKEYSYELREDMRRETELLFETVLRENRSILDFLDAKYTFVNGRLAKLYGIDGVEGDGFQKVSLEGRPRAGVLTQASILTLTSDPTRTSPVKRGKWILENILGTPPPPPPPNVPELEETRRANPDAPLSKQLELHRKSPMCASCHKLMDPLGLGFENFDAIGRWRDKDGRHPIEASGTLPTGEVFHGPVELIKILKSRDEQFARHLTRKMLTYALGRGLEKYDKCTVNEIATALKQNDYRFRTLVTEIVQSDPFRMRRGTKGGDQ